jgi:hypothetical protein
MDQREKVDRMVEGLIRLSRRVLSQDGWAREQAGAMAGRAAHLLVRTTDLSGTYSRRLTLGPGLEIMDAGGEEPYHTISVDYDTLLALLAGDLDWGTAWAQGRVEFDGPDYVRHAMLWERGFRRLRRYLEGG